MVDRLIDGWLTPFLFVDDRIARGSLSVLAFDASSFGFVFDQRFFHRFGAWQSRAGNGCF